MDSYLYRMDNAGYPTRSRSEMMPPSADPSVNELLGQELRRAISTTRQFFFNHQHPDGYWVGELEGDSLLQSEAIMLLAFLGEEDCDLARGCAQRLLNTQQDDGGWGQYTGAKSDVCNTVKAYFALKIMGHDPAADYMQKARMRARDLGGVDAVNSFTRFYLAILGQIPHSACPAVPPQMMFLPTWFPINIYSMSSWSRTIFVPLSIVSTLAPVKKLPPEKGIKEIFIKDPKQWGPLVAPGKKYSRSPFSWDSFFRGVEHGIKFCRKIGFTPFRKRAIRAALDWTLKHCEKSDGPGAIQPPIVWTWIALKSLGYADISPEIQYCRKQFFNLVLWNDAKTEARLQPCKSPVWDTSLTLKALMLGGLTAAHPAVRKGVRWLRSQQVKVKGDWAKNVAAPPGGWCFEFNNPLYPDCDDSAMALMVLAGSVDEARISGSASGGKSNLPPDLRIMASETTENLGDAKQNLLDVTETTMVLESGLRWLLAMQCKDGGWAAFDKDNNRDILCKVPFADHNAMIDPSTPDLTGRIMESLGRLGFRWKINPEINRVVEFMRKEQQADGSWFGRWGVNYIYGTWQALTGLSAVGVPTNDPTIQNGANWLLTHQHPSGGWGESPDSYADPSTKGHGNPTASQTAWAVMGLIAAGKLDDPAGHNAIQRGIRFLLDRQRHDGTWYEAEFTGTGFPLVFYLKYHYYSVYFPLMALSLYAAKTKVANGAVCDQDAVVRMEKMRVFSPEKARSSHHLNPLSDQENKGQPQDNPPRFQVYWG